MRTLQSYFDEWITYLKVNGRATKTIEIYTILINRVIEKVNECNINKLLDALAELKNEQSLSNYAMIVDHLKRLSNFALLDCDTEDTSFFLTISRKIKKPSVPDSVLRIPTDEEFNALLNAAKGMETGYKHAVEVCLLGRAGLRAGEVVRVSWNDIDFDRGTMVVGGKQGKLRTLPFNHDPELLNALLMRRQWYETVIKSVYRQSYAKEPVHYVISQYMMHRKIAKRRLTTNIIAAEQAAGIPHYRLHDYRHYYACSLARRGVPVNFIQKALGHSSLAMTEQYLRGLNADMDSLRIALSIGFPIGGDVISSKPNSL